MSTYDDDRARYVGQGWQESRTVQPPKRATITVDIDRLYEWLAIPADELSERSPLPLTVVPTPRDVHLHFAREMFEEAAQAAEAGEELAIIVPLGPKGHYPLLADMVNTSGLSLEHVTYFGMDQWLDWQGRALPFDHPFNVEGYFHRHFLERLGPGVRPRPENVIFPSVLELDHSSEEIARRGGAATTYAGFGFQGHIAFNEPPSTRWSPVSLEQLREGRTRILSLAIDTLIAHAQRSLGGNVSGVPPMAVTLGMKDLLASRRIRLYTDGGSWKQTILRILLFCEPTVDYPVTLIHDHPDVHVIVDAASAACPPMTW
jgi:glucosamine-6-phosphate deaminase